MLKYVRNTMGIKEKTDLENARNELARAKATMDYIAMMADVELLDDGTGDGEGGIHNEQEV